METDREFSEASANARMKRRRVALSFLALLACVLMLTDLILKAETNGARGLIAAPMEKVLSDRWFNPETDFHRPY